MIKQLTLFPTADPNKPILLCITRLVRGKERKRKYKQRGKKNGTKKSTDNSSEHR